MQEGKGRLDAGIVRVVHWGCRAVCVGRKNKSSVQGLDLEGGCCRMLSRITRNGFTSLGKQAGETGVLLQEEGSTAKM